MRLLLASLTVATTSLFAQANDPATKKVDVKFRALSFDAPIMGSGFLDGREAKRLDISNDFLSGEQTYRGLPTIEFVMVDDLEKKAPEVPVELINSRGRLARAMQAAKKANDALLALTKGDGNAPSSINESNIGKRNAQSDAAELSQNQVAIGLASKALAEANKEIEEAQAEVNNRQRDHQQALSDAKAAKAGKGKAATPAPTKAAGADKGKDPKAPYVPPTPIASYTFPGDGKFILLFASAEKGKRIMAIEDKEGSFPFGSYLYINLTGVPVEVRYNGKASAIPPNGRAVINAPVANDTYAQGEIWTPGEDGYQIGYIARTYQQADVRTLFFILPNQGGGHAVNIKGIEERKQPDPVPDPNAGAAKGGNKPNAGKAAK